MKKILSVILSVICLSSVFSVLTFAEDRIKRDWESAYAQIIKATVDSWLPYCQLVDFDLDGTPELLIGWAPGNSGLSTAAHLFTFCDKDADGIKELVELETEEHLPLGGRDDGYTLYQHNITKELFLENMHHMRAGFGNYAITDLATYVMGDKLYMTEIFTQNTVNGSTKYYVYDDSLHNPLQQSLWVSEYETSELGYDYSLNNFHNGWQKIDSYKSASMYNFSPTNKDIEDFLASYEDGPALAVRSMHNVTLNDEEILPDKPSGYNIAGRNYYRLRDVAATLADTPAKFSINYDAATHTIILETEKDYTSERWDLDGTMNVTKNLLGIPSKDNILIDGKAVSLKAYKIDNENYFELRDLGAKLGFGVGWDAETETVQISAMQWQLPIKDHYYTQPFYNTHLGVDITSSSSDTTVYAAADGTVVFAGSNGSTADANTIPEGLRKGNGYCIVIEHSLGDQKLYTFYAHLKEGSFKVGDKEQVKAGQPIAIYGNTGNSSGPHLHFAIVDTKKNGSYLGYTRDGTTISGDKHYESSYGGMTFYNPTYVIENQKLPE